jgi:hypothetical protein
MKRRSFVRKNGKTQIKKEYDLFQLDGHHSVAIPGSKQDKIFRADKLGFIRLRSCAFVRTYIPGEYDGHDLPKDLNLDEITHTFVIIAMSDLGGHDGVQHVLEHLQPLGETYKAVVFDMEGGKPMNARVPLLPEQAEIIKRDIEGGHK